MYDYLLPVKYIVLCQDVANQWPLIMSETLSQTPPELAADIYNTGIYLAGGGSMLRGLDKRLSQKTDLPVYIAEDPLRAVVRGTGITLKNLPKYKSVLIK